MSPNIGNLKEEVMMNHLLIKFYLVFLFVCLALFSFENKTVEKRIGPKSSNEVLKDKKPYRHYYRFSNLC